MDSALNQSSLLEAKHRERDLLKKVEALDFERSKVKEYLVVVGYCCWLLLLAVVVVVVVVVVVDDDDQTKCRVVSSVGEEQGVVACGEGEWRRRCAWQAGSTTNNINNNNTNNNTNHSNAGSSLVGARHAQAPVDERN